MFGAVGAESRRLVTCFDFGALRFVVLSCFDESLWLLLLRSLLPNLFLVVWCFAELELSSVVAIVFLGSSRFLRSMECA